MLGLGHVIAGHAVVLVPAEPEVHPHECPSPPYFSPSNFCGSRISSRAAASVMPSLGGQGQLLRRLLFRDLLPMRLIRQLAFELADGLAAHLPFLAFA